MRRESLFLALLAGCASAGTSVPPRATTPSLDTWWPMAFRVSRPVQRDSAPTPPAAVEIERVRYRRFPDGAHWLYVADTTQLLAAGSWGCEATLTILYRRGVRVTVPTTGRGAMVQAGILASEPPCRSLDTAAYFTEMRVLADSTRRAMRTILLGPIDSTTARERARRQAPPNALRPPTRVRDD